MSLLAWILLIFGVIALLLFGAWTYSTDLTGSEDATQTCAASDSAGFTYCGPELINGEYQVPDSGVVVHAAHNNGTVAPEYQQGYDIEVDADGTVIVQETTPSGGLGTPTASATAIRTFTVEDWQIQSLLASIDGCGFYYLPQLTNAEIADAPVGGGADEIQVSLDDGNWSVAGGAISPDDQATFAGCQSVIAEFAGVAAGT